MSSNELNVGETVLLQCNQVQKTLLSNCLLDREAYGRFRVKRYNSTAY